MKFFIDTADLAEIRDLAETGLLDGVTTNPSLVAKSGQNFIELVKEICQIDTVGQRLLKSAMEKLNLSARAYDRILKVSRTIADLSASDEIRPEHLAEAIQYRSLDREGWAG